MSRPGVEWDSPSVGGALRWGTPLLLLAIGVALAAWSWGSWPDVIVDFGRELYVPWRLSQGAVLFRDIAWFNGPLSPYWNALSFGLFGTGLDTLVATNLVLLAVLVLVLHHLLRRVGGAPAAAIACAVFLLVYAFGQYLEVGNYNYVCPYSHEATHGLLLALLCLALLDAWRARGGAVRAGAAGALLGLALLTKAEVSLALLPAAAVLLLGSGGGASRTRSRAVFAIAALVPPLVAFGLLATAMPASQALRGTLGTWGGIFASDVAALPYYRLVAGLDHPLAHSLALLRWSAGWGLALAPGVLLAFAAARAPRHAGLIAVGAFALAAGALFALRAQIAWLHLARPLPLVALLIVFGAACAARRAGTAESRRRASLVLALAVFALLLMAKVILAPFVTHYGFTLTLPAAMLTLVALLAWIPHALARRGADPRPFRAAVLGLLLAVSVAHLEIQARWNARKDVVVGTGRDRFRADARGRDVRDALAALERLPADVTLVAAPEGVMLNYLSRRVNPTPYVNFMPPELELFGEARIVEALAADPPGAIALVHRRTREYGAPLFGHDYAPDLAAWIAAHYTPTALIGEEPLRPTTRTFGIRLMQRKDRRRGDDLDPSDPSSDP